MVATLDAPLKVLLEIVAILAGMVISVTVVLFWNTPADTSMEVIVCVTPLMVTLDAMVIFALVLIYSVTEALVVEGIWV